jgi:hypothetical protein
MVDQMMDIVVGFLVCAAVVLVTAAAVRALSRLKASDAYVYVPDGVALAEWQYKQLPMHECKFCGSRVNLNRHHVISQLACPERRDDPGNLIVLCRSCHQVVGHKNNWKKFNPHVAEICEKYGGPPVDSREWREANERKQK